MHGQAHSIGNRGHVKFGELDRVRDPISEGCQCLFINAPSRFEITDDQFRRASHIDRNIPVNLFQRGAELIERRVIQLDKIPAAIGLSE